MDSPRVVASIKGRVGETYYFLALNVNISKTVGLDDTVKLTINH